MAFTMKHWLGTVFTAFAVVAIWTLPPAGSPADDFQVPSAEQIRSLELGGEYRVASEVYRRVVWSDTLVPLVTSPTAADIDVLYLADESLADAQKARYLAKIESEVRALEPSGDVRFALALLDRSIGLRPGMGAGGLERAEYFAGEANGQKYCMLVRLAEGRDFVRTVARELAGTDRVDPVSNSLGLCAHYIRHGMPGANIEEWISGGAATLAYERGHEDRPEIRLRSRSFLGMRWGNRPFHLDRCISGDAPSCAEVFESPRGSDQTGERNRAIVAQSPALWIGSWPSTLTIAGDDAFMLADLEEEFGRDAFTRFWTSEADVLTAFEKSFGAPAGDWVVSWISQRYELESRGPTLNRAATSGSLVIMFLMLLLAFSNQRKRTVVP